MNADHCRYCSKWIIYLTALVGWVHADTKSIYCDSSGTSKAVPE